MKNKSRKFNWKARQSKGNESDSQRPKDADNDYYDSKYDSCNAFVLPTKSIQSKHNRINKSNKVDDKEKHLSKKQRKKLEKVLERKKKKLNRAELVNALEKYKINDNEYELMASTSGVQTNARKRINEIKSDILENPSKNISLNAAYKRHKKEVNKTFENTDIDLNTIAVSTSNTVLQSEHESNTDSESECDNDLNSDIKVNTQLNTLDICDKNEEKVTKNSQNIDTKEKRNTNSEETSKTESEKLNQMLIDKKKKTFVKVNRLPEFERSRSALPIVSEEHTIMEAIYYNSIVILCGETGSGKTTQLPQFLYEAGYASDDKTIVVTEPRRVAAISMSKRIASEMNLSFDEVSYQIRFKGNVTPKTKIKFVTDGVLLKEIQNDFLLLKYSVVVIDEAHERSLHTDILIGLLSRIVPLRNKKQIPLKLIIMSATLRIEDFTSNNTLFKKTPPVLKIESRQYPVTVHFNKKTPDDYLDEAFKKVCKIHCEQPSGGILVFVTGRQEVELLCKRLKYQFQQNSLNNNCAKETRKRTLTKKENQSKSSQKIAAKELPVINLDHYEINPLNSERILDDLDYSDEDISSNDDEDIEVEFKSYSNTQPLHCLPLYSLLPHSKQALIFNAPPKGSRLCVISTNVAETSLTIPNIAYVVDTGKIKTKIYDSVTGISTFVINWTSKASADQRAGRAGRTSAGHCYRLYSSSVFNDEFAQFSEPEIVRKPIDDLVLQMKAMNIENVINFPFPSLPSKESLYSAEKRLVLMGALKEIKSRFDRKSKGYSKNMITPLGKAMSSLPVCPRYAKMIALSFQQNITCYTIVIVAALTVDEVFICNNSTQDNMECDNNLTEKRIKRTNWCERGYELLLGDCMALLNAVGSSQFVKSLPKFCQQNGLRYNAIVEIHKLRKHLTSQLKHILDDSQISLTASPPNEMQIKLLRQIVLCGFFDHIAKKISGTYLNDDEKRRMKNAYQSIEVESPVFIYSNSVLKDELPEYVAYQQIFESSKLFMRNVIAIEPEWLPLYVPHLCEFSNPLQDSLRYDGISDSIKCYRSSTFGPYGWSIPAVETDYPPGVDKFKLFAKFLLEGEVVPFFKNYNKLLLSPPAIIVKSWASLQPKTEKLFKAIASYNIDNRHKLLEKWKTDKTYLLSEYKNWLPQSYHSKIESLWPPI